MAISVTIRPNTKGPIALGKLARGISSFHAATDERWRIILVTYTEFPTSEKRMLANGPAPAAVKKGLSQTGAWRFKSRGSSARFATDKID